MIEAHRHAAIRARGDVHALTDVKPLVSALNRDYRSSTPVANPTSAAVRTRECSDEGHPRLAQGRPVPDPGIPLPHIGAAATRALTAHGVVRLEQVARLSEDEVQALHGVGPYALSHLRTALDAAGLAFRADPGASPQAGATPETS